MYHLHAPGDKQHGTMKSLHPSTANDANRHAKKEGGNRVWVKHKDWLNKELKNVSEVETFVRGSGAGMDRQLPTLKRKKIIEDDKPEIADFSSRSNPKGYFNQEIRSPNGNVVKITASQRSGPFYVRKYTDHGNKVTDENSRLTTLKGAYGWAKKHLAAPTFSKLRQKLTKEEDIDRVGVPDYDMAEVDSGHEIVPNIGLDDRLFTENDPEEESNTVPADVVSSGRLYTT